MWCITINASLQKRELILILLLKREELIGVIDNSIKKLSAIWVFRFGDKNSLSRKRGIWMS
jgi:hypothetical protein